MTARGPISIVSAEVPDAALEHSKLVLEAMRDLAEKQLERAERVRTAARQTFVYVSTLFAVTQAVAFTGFAGSAVSPAEKTSVLGLGIVAAGVLGVTGILVVWTDKLRTVPDVAAKDIIREADRAIELGEDVADRLTKLYLDSARERESAVSQRRRLAAAVSWLASGVVVLALGEIVVSLASRLP